MVYAVVIKVECNIKPQNGYNFDHIEGGRLFLIPFIKSKVIEDQPTPVLKLIGYLVVLLSLRK